MSVKRVLTVRQVLMGRLQRGDDLLMSLTEVCKAQGITLGQVRAIGAVEQAVFGSYDQQSWQYIFLTVDRPLELLSLIGNISQRDGDTVIHAHVVMSDEECNTCGGHLAEGTRVFACEYVIEEFFGSDLQRARDEQTGLPLWKG
ncbi:MAG: PPC domain-containing DNA-binding protein [Armatimonadota bacterium]